VVLCLGDAACRKAIVLMSTIIPGARLQRSLLASFASTSAIGRW
jgi:hypothetical protein